MSSKDNTMSLGEFDLIHQYFSQGFPNRPDVKLGIGDDGAVCQIPSGMQLVVSVDTLVEGKHFPVNTSAQNIGYKSLAVNLSDMAAMGAVPSWMTLALSLPNPTHAWLTDFRQGLLELAEDMQVSLIGGDTTASEKYITITLQIMGFVPLNSAIQRKGAMIGDKIYVTGTLGDAGLGLASLQNWVELAPSAKKFVEKRLNRPIPRVKEGQALRNVATSMIDISDGLLSDLSHITEANALGATLHLSQLPLSNVLQENLPRETAWNLALSAGDDYELCFTIPPSKESLLINLLPPQSYTVIGTIEASQGIRCLYPNGKLSTPTRRGYEHFKYSVK